MAIGGPWPEFGWKHLHELPLCRFIMQHEVAVKKA